MNLYPNEYDLLAHYNRAGQRVWQWDCRHCPRKGKGTTYEELTAQLAGHRHYVRFHQPDDSENTAKIIAQLRG